MSSPRTPRQPLAIVGASALFPGSSDATGFWRDILAGTDRITDVPPTHWLVEDYYDPDPTVPDKTYAKRGAFLDPVDFDAMGWGIPPSIVPETDTSQLLSLIVAQRVLEDAAKGQPESLDRSRISVILGVTSGQELLGTMVSRLQRPVWVKALRESGMPEDEVEKACERISSHYVPWRESTFPGLLGNVVAGRIANRLNLGGTNCVTDAACASAFSAVSMAANELYLNDSDMVIVGGVDTMNDIFMFMCFSKTPALSPTGDCRPFSDRADGTMLGEGIAMLALKRLADAERDGDRVYAVLHGVGSSSDGRAKSVYAPRAEGQAEALRRAYGNAGYGPETVELVEAHGTGTKAGDAAEFEGLRTVFDESGRKERQWCALGSVKSQIGHTKSTAGAAGLFKAVMALHHRVLPPTIKVDRPNPALDLPASPFNLTGRARPWVRGAAHPRRASVSSFGFGGSNFHLALSEYDGPAEHAPRLRALDAELVLLSGDSLGAELRRHAKLAATPGYLSWLARESQASFDPGKPARLAIVAANEAALVHALEIALKHVEAEPLRAFSNPHGIHYAVSGAGSGKEIADGGVAFLFPGQGSQYVDMGAGLAMGYASALAPWDAAADLELNGGTRLHEVVFPITSYDEGGAEAQAERLTTSEWVQPAIACVSLSMLALLRELGLRSDMFGGHSLGELSALHAAGAFSATDLIKIASKRGRFMAAAASVPGTMAAIALPIDEVRAAIAECGAEVVVANHNSPTQVVVSGATGAVLALEKHLAARGAHARTLRVATAFHSPIVAPASATFARYLEGMDVKGAALPVYGNATAAPYPADPAATRKILAEQISQPVHFLGMVEAMYAAGARTFVEVGPGSVLTGLVERILKDRPHQAVSLDRRGKTGIASFLEGVGKLAIAGRKLDFTALWRDYAIPSNPHDRVKPKLTIPICGSNYGKPYPPVDGARSLPPPNPPRPVVPTSPVPSPVPASATVAPPPVAPVPVAAAPAPVAAAANADMVSSFLELQRQTASAHETYLKVMADSHAAFLDAVAGTPAMLAGTDAIAARAPRPTAAARPPVAAPAAIAPAPPAPALAAKAPAPSPVPTVPVAPPRPAPPVAAPPAPAVAAVDLHSLMLQIVSDKTGYPQEMLTLGMDLEGDLGIDSIKRVEILSAVQDRVPGLPQVDTAAMAKLRTLGQVADYVAALLPRGASAPSPAQPAMPALPAAAAPAGATPGPDLQALMLEVVAAKTGYPQEMLNLEMDLEGDLGIDSIKRVEILSAVQDRVPGLPQVDTAAMAKLRTLGQVAGYVASLLPASTGAAAPAVAPAAAAPAVTAAAGGLDLQDLMLEVVAAKTGYPKEMLNLEMDLEGDLGIDSIKRVEILSAVQDRVPGLPQVDTAAMAKLRTLGQVAGYVASLLPGARTLAPTVVPAAAAPAAAAPAATGGLDLQDLMLEVVAAKTGYPKDMLNLEMDLEGDLGIDSIKRVEVLSAVQDRVPGLPQVDTAAMAKLRTLGQVAGYVASLLPGAARAAAPAAAPAKTPSSTPAGTTSPTPVAMAPAAMAPRRFVLRAVEAPASGLVRPGLRDGRVLVTGDGPVQRALIVALRQRGVRAEAATDPADIDGEGLAGIVFLGGLRDVASTDEAISVNRAAFATARIAASRLAERGVFVTVQDTGGRFGLGTAGPSTLRAWLAGSAALARTAQLEWPERVVRTLDVERGDRSADEVARVVADELLAGGPELEVGLTADGHRLTLRDLAEEGAPGPSALGDGDVVVVSGGARGVTAAAVIALARTAHLRFVLLGRTPLGDEPASCAGVADEAGLKRALLAEAKRAGRTPTPVELGKAAASVLALREIRASLAAIAAAGSEARYVAADIADSRALAAALDDVRSSWGGIAAVVHGAGVLADKRIAEKSDEQFARVFDTKVKGLANLLAATDGDPLKVLALFSSVAARCGNPGQCDYAMANEVLNKVGEAERRRRGIVVKSFGWGPWEGGMVTPELKALFAARGVPLIPLDAGARMFADELTVARADVELVVGGDPAQGLASGAARAELRLEVTVDLHSHPYLKDHAINGTPVVPVVLVIEWFSRAARTFRPELELHGLRDLKVLRGIPVADIAAGLRLFVTARLQGGALTLELTGPDGAVHYRATAETSAPGAAQEPRIEDDGAPSDLDLAPYTRDLVYGEELFHGPKFQVIRSIDGISKRGMAARMAGVRQMGWSAPNGNGDAAEQGGDPWQTDPAALDGGLQLAVLWFNHMLGGASLPTSIARVRTYDPGAPAGMLHGVLRGREAKGQRAISDVVLKDDQGRTVTVMEGVEVHRRPDRT